MADILRPRKTRARSGCLCCRLRRKKCDERKPICSGCDRNKLLCSWAPKHGQVSDLGWRNRLESGERVSQVGKDFEPIRSAPGSSNPTETYQQHPKQESSIGQSPASQLRFPEMFGTASLKSHSSRILFEHYINNTSHLLCTIRGPENPFITCVIPLARTDPMIMDCVLAISGAHLGCAASDPEIPLASSTHYALALRQFKHTLTQTASGKGLKPVNLLLTALMLCHVEVSAQEPSQHLRYWRHEDLIRCKVHIR
jgi:Fungal specific transcription factor domain/Fungal Zn(2)-Cys(6) binuclear cluster domain